MNKRFHFTQPKIKNLPIPEKGRVDYHDEGVLKLICRVSHTGAKSFIVTKWAMGKVRNVTIGKFPAVAVETARKEAQIIIGELIKGVDRIADKREAEAEARKAKEDEEKAKKKKADAKTKLKDVLEKRIALKVLRPVTAKNYRYKLKLGFPDWLDKPVDSITELMVEERYKRITENQGATTANTTMRVLRLTLRYAKSRKMIERVATDVMRKDREALWHKRPRKDRIIPSAQLKTWHEAVEALPNQRAKVYLLIALYMGFRSKELLTMEWKNVDFRNKIILVTGTKNGTDHALPIPEALIPFIESLQPITGRYKWVFASKHMKNPTAQEQKHGKQMSVPTKAIIAVIKNTGIEFSSHDCRRTFATITEAVNLPTTMLKRLMNHTTAGDVTSSYVITEEETKREAINKIAAYIQARVTAKSNVIRLHG